MIYDEESRFDCSIDTTVVDKWEWLKFESIEDRLSSVHELAHSISRRTWFARVNFFFYEWAKQRRRKREKHRIDDIRLQKRNQPL